MGWGWYYIVEYVLLPCIVANHIAGLVFLRRTKDSKRYKNQVIIVTTLCIFELTGTALIISHDIFDYLVSSFVADIIMF